MSSGNRQTDDGEGSTNSSSLAMSLTSDEVNYLVYRYLQESGFVHSAFTFVYESMLGKTNIRNGDRSIPPGALISFLQKGLQYVGVEESLHRESKKGHKNKAVDASAGDEPDFSLLSPPVIATLTRTNPPIQLNLPPAAAAAAVKSRLETQAKLQAAREEREERERKAARQAARAEQLAAKAEQQAVASSASAALSEKATVPQQLALEDSLQNPRNTLHARETLVAQVVAAQAVVVSQAIKSANSGRLSPFAQSQQQFQEDVVPGSSAVQIATQEQQLEEKQLQTGSHKLAQAQHEANNQGLQALSSASISSSKEVKEAKRKKKEKANKKQQKQQQQQQQEATATISASSNPLHLIASQASATPGFSTLEEAVARLEASKMASNARANTPQPVDVDDNNGNMSSQARLLSPSLAAHGPADATKVLELVNGQHSYPPNGSRQPPGPMPLNGKSAALSAAELLAEVSSSQKRKLVSDAHILLPSKQSHQEQSVPIQGSSIPSVKSTAILHAPTEKEIDQEDRLTNACMTEILELKMHSSEVFMCAWNPVFTSFIATGSGDASARIWQMGGTDAAAGLGPVRLLPHGDDTRDKKNKDVTTLEWSSDGKLLATGSYDGVARVWSRNGTLLHTLRGHKGPIFSLKWNKRGNYLLSGSYDKTTIVWDVSGSTGFIEQQFSDHEAPALDVDWRDDTTFASCSTDKTVNICKVGVARPLKTYSGHEDEVNAVKWDPSGTLLASCSDDCTAKVWDVTSDRIDPLQDFKSHRQEIYTVKWSPTGPGSVNPHKQRILATASFDGSVRLWDVQDGSCIRVFSRHRDSVYSVSFSPSGCFLASGSLAGQLYIWNVQEGRPVKSYKGKGDIFEVAWNKEETRVAACFSSNIVAILDFKIQP